VTTVTSTETVYVALYFYSTYPYYLIFIISFNNNNTINIAFTTVLAKTHSFAVHTLMLPKSLPCRWS